MATAPLLKNTRMAKTGKFWDKLNRTSINEGKLFTFVFTFPLCSSLLLEYRSLYP